MKSNEKGVFELKNEFRQPKYREQEVTDHIQTQKRFKT